MSGLLPSEPDIEAGDGEPRVIGVDSEDADRLLAALSSTTSRNVLAALHDEPATPSEVASSVDTSLQNVQYHLEKLQDADLIEVRGTRYSEKGREMNVYGPSDRPLVVFAGTEDQSQGVKSALANLLGGVGALGVASLVVQQVFGDGLGLPSLGGSGKGGDAATTTPAGGGVADVTEATETAARTTTAAGDAVSTFAGGGTARPPAAGGGVNISGQDLYQTTRTAEEALGFPPGLLFFAGGLLVLGLVAGWWHLRTRGN